MCASFCCSAVVAVVGGMMEPTDGSPPNSMYMVRCGEMFPKPAMEKEDDKLAVPFKERKLPALIVVDR